ncbi:MAG: hypothetical protein DRQ49_03000 [Gammaproteobacteria bacterium]|nr:MAG: hypothetical protein DRQ49_03000 [Gammaproteobacteria bacterium]RKZ44909.1 MAG: hypothetical protein DRQ41_01645 [Gammaproteobacteria bacterium]RKZ77035.1 MAG: hypothetical protein DRQ57_01520 [Gammaproteobacteria bacterium]
MLNESSSLGLEVNLTQKGLPSFRTVRGCMKPLCGIECQRLGLLNQDSSCNPSGLSTENELPKNVQLCLSF